MFAGLFNQSGGNAGSGDNEVGMMDGEGQETRDKGSGEEKGVADSAEGSRTTSKESSRPNTKEGSRPSTKEKKKRDNEDDEAKDGEVLEDIEGEENKEGEDADPESKKKKKKKGPKEGDVDKTRELLSMEICSIQVFNLIPAHRFKKNLPWLKVNYGKEHEWIAPYEDSDNGERADFLELNWNFILQRDTRHRQDLIVTVMSEELIVGRYVLGAADFGFMPVTSTNFFSVSGNVINALGVAGQTKLIFKKIVAEPPKAPRFYEARPNTITHSFLPHDVRSYVRFISCAVADLKSVHGFFEYNSPYIEMTCGKWRKTTDVKVGAGLAAKWNRLPWKLVMDKFHPLVISVMSAKPSGNLLIGMIQFTLDDLKQMEENDQGFLEIVKPITDGATLTGRIRLYLMIKEMDPETDPSAMQIAIPMIGYGEDTADPESELNKAPDKVNINNAAKQMGVKTAKKNIFESIKVQLKPNNVSDEQRQKHAGLALSSNLITGAIEFVPFVMRVSEAGVFNTKRVEPLKPNSLSLNAACGAWGGSTIQLKNCGSDAYWVGMESSWRFVVEDGSRLFLNVWSRNTFVGSVSLGTDDIKVYPIDPDGNTEIMLSIYDEGKSTGRLRLNCTFEYLRTGEDTNYDPQPKAVIYKPPGAKRLKANEYGEVPRYDLPCVATMICISCVDLKNAHTFVPNSPRVRIVCDRKQAMTPILKYGGKIARWEELNWDIPLNEGCVMMCYVYSGNKQIGLLELPAHTITREPLDEYGYTQICHMIRNHDGLSTGKMTLIFQLNNLPDVQIFDAIQENGGHRNPYGALGVRTIEPTEEYQQDPIIQMMATQPFFSLADAMDSGVGIMLHVHIMEVDVTDLDAVHWFGKKNSPVVSGACGRWAATTSAKTEAGADAFWEGLTWKFLMDDKINVQFVCGSGRKVIGSTKVNAKEFAEGRADQRGIKRLHLNMHSAQHHFAGKLKLTYHVGVVRENQVIHRPRQIERIHDEDIQTPYNATVRRITATGMPRVHDIGPNEARFRISHDDWAKTTPTSTTGESDEAVWTFEQLDQEVWKVPILAEDQPITMSIISGSELIGINEIMPNDLALIPRTVEGVAEVKLPLMKNGKNMGQLQVYLHLLNQSTKFVPDNIEEEERLAEEAARLEEMKAHQRQSKWEGKQNFQDPQVIQRQRAQFSHKLEDYNSKKERERREQQQKEALDQIKRLKLQQELEIARDREMALQHKLMLQPKISHKYAPVGENPGGYTANAGANSMGFMLSPGSAVLENDDGSLADVQSFEGMPLHDDKRNDLVLDDVGSLAGGSVATTGTRHAPKPPSGPRPGDHEKGDTRLPPIQTNQISSNQSVSTASNGGNGSPSNDHGTNLIAQHSKGAKQAKAYNKEGVLTNKFDDFELGKQRHHSTNVPEKFSIHVQSVAVLDCRSVHLMKKNNLQTTLEYGTQNFSSEVLEQAGDVGQWSGLAWNFSVRPKSNNIINVAVLSGTAVVGTIEYDIEEMYRKSMLEAENAVVKMFSEMREGSTFCGRIRLGFRIKTD